MNYLEAQAQADILKAVAHPIRLLILNALSRKDRCVTDLLGVARVDQSTISRHLAQLKRAGIVTERRAGARVIHHLECPCILRAVSCSMQVLSSVARRSSQVLKKQVRT